MKNDIGFEEALQLTLDTVASIGTETVPAVNAAGRTAAKDVRALVDSPSADASLKDGYAVISTDIAGASMKHPVKLALVDHVSAGGRSSHFLRSGETIRILTGAPLPEGADAVLTEEFANQNGDHVYACADAGPGRNILEKGKDVSIGQALAPRGKTLTARHIGLLIAGGVSHVSVYKRPAIGLLATGTEIIMPDAPMSPGKIYASNVGLQQAWLTMLGFEARVMWASDTVDRISSAMRELIDTCDVVITSGGAWKGERDLTVLVMESLSGRMVFHRLRLGPGKATGMGILNNAPVFCLPGGPSSNMFGFLMIVLPALFKMSGIDRSPHLIFEGKLEASISGQADWTNLVQCDIIRTKNGILLRPKKLKSRLWAMATQPAVVVIPEGVKRFEAGETVPFICLDMEPLMFPRASAFKAGSDFPGTGTLPRK